MCNVYGIICVITCTHANHGFHYDYIDVDECADFNGGCQHNCTNTIGSHYCTCAGGYLLNDDGHSCTGIGMLSLLM